LLTTDGETIGIRGALSVDARQLLEFHVTEEMAGLEAAAAIYRGQFLSDVPIEGEEFRDWVSWQRSQIDAAAGAVLSQLASCAGQAGDARKALLACSRLTAIDPFREDWLRLSLTLSALHLGRDQALIQARTFAALLRKELDVAPEAETAALIDQIKAGRIVPNRIPDISPRSAIERSPPSSPAEDDAATLPRWRTAARFDGRAAMISALIVALIAVLAMSLSVTYRPSTPPTRISSASSAIDTSTIPLLIAPLQSDTAETAQLARAITENILTNASRFSGLTVLDGRSLEPTRSRLGDGADRLALQINPRIERAYYWLGNIYLGRGQRDLALQSFERALQLNPSFIPAEAHAGFALVLSRRINEGLARIETALNTGLYDPNERLWLRFAGIAELELGNDGQAIKSLLQAASFAAPTPPLHAALASAYALTGRRAESREQFRLMKETADPLALEQLLEAASRENGHHPSRYFQGLTLASRDAL
jgi:tetratricopeptide (TPR) repeat protein